MRKINTFKSVHCELVKNRSEKCNFKKEALAQKVFTYLDFNSAMSSSCHYSWKVRNHLLQITGSKRSNRLRINKIHEPSWWSCYAFQILNEFSHFFYIFRETRIKLHLHFILDFISQTFTSYKFGLYLFEYVWKR